jgi:NADH dehydrogenase
MMLVLGATGFLGGHVLRRFRQDRYPVKLFTRGSRDWRDSSVTDLHQKGVDFVIADALDLEKLAQAADGCTAIINMVGTMPPTPGTDFKAQHVTVAQNILEVAKTKGIQRIIHISCLGADEDVESDYLRTKFEAEAIIRQAKLYWTIFRPSYIFADKFPFLDTLMPFIKIPVVMPVLGSGQQELQPVHAKDVAECMAMSLYDKDTVSRTFDLGGPKAYTIQELMEASRKALGIGGGSMNVPTTSASKAAETVTKFLPKMPVNTELLKLWLLDSTTEDNAVESYFKLSAMPLDASFERILQLR